MIDTDPGLEAAARALLAKEGVIDLHADPLLWARLCGYDLNRRHVNRLPRSPWFSHSDVPRWREAAMSLVFNGVVTFPKPGRGDEGAFDQACRTIRIARETSCGSKGAYVVVEDEATYRTTTSGSCVGGLLALEGAHALEGSIENFERLLRLGVRSIGLAHFHRNAAVSPSYGRGGDRGPLSKPAVASTGLTPFGRELVRAMAEHRILIDLAHVSRSGFLETAASAGVPVFVSHTGVAGAFEHWRNIDDEQVGAIVRTGGIIGVIFAGRYLGGSGIDAVVDHIDHLVKRFGQRAPAIGSDFDGMIVPVKGLADVSAMWRLVAAMLRRGYGEELIGRILSRNAREFVESVTGWSSR